MDDAAQQLNDRATALMAEEHWEEAIRLIESQPEMFVSDVDLSWNLGWAYFKLGNWRVAEGHLSRATTLAPTREAAWWGLATVQQKSGKLMEAEHSVKKALRLRDSTRVRRTLALILMKRGKLAEAERVHRQGIELRPESPGRWRAYACFLDDVGRQAEAEIAYKKARMFEGS